jgi:hypothetical protein
VSTAAKIGVVSAGYVLAFLLASGVVAVRMAATSGPAEQRESGMYAAGDSILFLAVFGAASAIPTCLGMFFLRPFLLFWRAASLTALAVASTGIIGLATYIVGRGGNPHSLLTAWASYAVLRVFVGPLLIATFIASALFAPNRSSRIAFILSGAIEIGVLTSFGLMWFVQNRSYGAANAMDAQPAAVLRTVANPIEYSGANQ